MEAQFIKKKHFKANHDFQLFPLDKIEYVGVLHRNTAKIYIEKTEDIAVLKNHGCFGMHDPKIVRIESKNVESDFITIETKCFIYKPPAASDSNPSTSKPDEQEDEDDLIGTDDDDEEQGKYFLHVEEAFFLAYALGRMVVKRHIERMKLLQFWNYCKKQTINGKPFTIFYAVYHYYRSKGWIVKRGDNYGVDLVLYKCHPQQYHSTYGVYILRENQKLDAKDVESLSWRHLAALCRVLKSVKKSLIVCQVSEPDDTLDSEGRPNFENYIVEETNVSQWFPGKHSSDDIKS